MLSCNVTITGRVLSVIRSIVTLTIPKRANKTLRNKN
ncbi:protein of unknown function [Candidatus Hydrogenisulfobacillus filiaventi]|uniref:Uncharacterized protein n=1 Tax=Candidatus Hydrogenisulfobacillus filiaventi TaxID=2707344 RepID=A0A6F8ZDI4_9FIRM|nr:protein of unknown function [Candidatus Hydrogenisulfobacillus filiaventi]